MIPRIKILCLISDLGNGGAEKQMNHILHRLPASKFELHLALWRDVRTHAPPSGIPVTVLEKHSTFDFPAAVYKTSRLIRAFKPDIVFSQLKTVNLAAGLALLLSGTSARWICRFNNAPEHEIQGAALFLIRALLPRAWRVLAVSEGVRKALIQHCRAAAGRTEAMPNIVDAELIDRLAAGPPPERNRGFTVVHAGRLHPQKNQSLLLQSFADMGDSDTELWMLGSGPLETELRKKAKSLGISERVKWFGFQENPYVYMKAADCFVLSSDYEGFPNVLYEAMLCGCAVIATRCPYGPDEIIGDGKSGLLIETGAAGELTAAMKKLRADPGLRAALGAGGRRQILERYGAARVIRRYEQLFQEAYQTGGEAKA